MSASKKLRPFLASTVAFSAFALSAGAAQASARDFTPAAGTYNVDTTALTITGPGTTITGTDVDGRAVFSFSTVAIPQTATLKVSGSRPFKLVASSRLTLAGVIFASGASATDETPGPNPGGPGGGAGGEDDVGPGAGPGGGGPGSTLNDGGGGAGFGGAGARGASDGGVGGAAGVAYGDLEVALQGGSGGAGATNHSDSLRVGGGGGGGAVELNAPSLTIASTGAVHADGGNGALGDDGGSGGGSGGAIIVRGDTVRVDGALSAVGGGGGIGGCCGDGGGGGGGRIAYHYAALLDGGTAAVTGGTSGAASTKGNLPGSFHSPDAHGANGVVSQAQFPQAATLAASSVGATGAILNGSVNPEGRFASYRFEYGTTTAYGSRAPATETPVGSDAATHAESQALTGLAPGTTYHYRIVATNSFAVVAGADQTFTTRGGTLKVTGRPTIAANGQSLSFSASCSLAPCTVNAVLTTVERLNGNKLVSLAAKRKKLRKRTVTVGSVTVTIAAGGSKSITVKLNATGRRLLRRFGKLPVTLTVNLVGPSGQKLKIKSQRLTLKPHKKHRKGKH